MRLKRSIENRHIVDTLFVLTIFAVFAVCSMLMIAFGARIYQKTVDNMDEHFNISTSITYVSEKLRQSDASNAIDIVPFGDSDAFRIASTVDEIDYYTYIYKDSGYLKELRVKADFDLAPSAGQKLLPISDWTIVKQTDNAFSYAITDIHDNTMISKFVVKTDH